MLKLDFLFEPLGALDAIIARQTRDQFEPYPLVENAADIFPRDTGHGGNVALTDFLANDDSAAADIVAEGFGQIEQRARHAALEREKTPRGDYLVGVAQPRRQQAE